MGNTPLRCPWPVLPSLGCGRGRGDIGASPAGPSGCQGPFTSGFCHHSVTGPMFPARKLDREGSGKGTPRVKPGHGPSPRQLEPNGSDLKVTQALRAVPYGGTKGSQLQIRVSKSALCHRGMHSRYVMAGCVLSDSVVLWPRGVPWSAPSQLRAAHPQLTDTESAWWAGEYGQARRMRTGATGCWLLPLGSPAGLGPLTRRLKAQVVGGAVECGQPGSLLQVPC